VTEIKAIQSTAAIEIEYIECENFGEMELSSRESICIYDVQGDRNSYLSLIR
jgi:hypothetical protein